MFTEEFNLLREPFSVSVNSTDSSVVVMLSAYPELLPEGVKIKSINGVEMSQMIEWMMTFASGERYFSKLDHLNVLFPALLQMKYHSDRFEIEYYEDKKVKKTSVPAISLSALREISSKRRNREDLLAKNRIIMRFWARRPY